MDAQQMIVVANDTPWYVWAQKVLAETDALIGHQPRYVGMVPVAAVWPVTV